MIATTNLIRPLLRSLDRHTSPDQNPLDELLATEDIVETKLCSARPSACRHVDCLQLLDADLNLNRSGDHHRDSLLVPTGATDRVRLVPAIQYENAQRESAIESLVVSPPLEAARNTDVLPLAVNEQIRKSQMP